MNKIPEHEDVDLIVISEAEAGQRLDKILALRYKDIKSRTYFEYLFENGFVLIHGNPIKKSLKPNPGDEIEVHFQIPPEITIAPESIPLDIIFEDEYLLVVNNLPEWWFIPL